VLYIDAESSNIRLRATIKFLLFQLLHANCDMSVYQSTRKCLYLSMLNLISQHHFFNLYFYVSVYKENKKIMNSNTEIYIVLKFTGVYHIILLLLAVLQCS